MARVTTGKGKAPRTPAVAYDVEEWMWGMDGASDGEPKWNDDMDHRANQ